MGPRYKRTHITDALADLIQREDGISFQRLARRLLREQLGSGVPHAEHNDLGRDASFVLHDGRTAVLCASLSATLSKIRSDIEKHQETGPLSGAILFCTPKPVVNGTIQKWRKAVKKEFDVDLEVLERTWVVDECLRPQNAFVVFEELRIFPPQFEKHQDPLIGPAVNLNKEIQCIGHTTCTASELGRYVVWSTTPTESLDEKVFLTCLTAAESDPVEVCEGADGDCLVRPEGVYVSWIRKDKAKRWTIAVAQYDHDLRNKPRTVVVADKVSHLFGRPQLADHEGQPYLFYSCRSKGGGPVLHTCPLLAVPTQRMVLQLRQASNVLIRHTGHLIVAIVEKAYPGEITRETEVFCFRKGTWTCVGVLGDAVEMRCGRYDVAVTNDKAMFIIESFFDSQLFSLSFDLATGQAGSPWHLTAGKFPSIVPHGGAWLASWVGAPVLPSEIQGRELIEISKKLWDEEISHRSVYARELRKGKTLNEIRAEYPDVGIWSPLWLSVLNPDGEGIKAYGPLGRGCDDNLFTLLARGDKRGVILWETDCDEDFEECRLVAREMVLP